MPTAATTIRTTSRYRGPFESPRTIVTASRGRGVRSDILFSWIGAALVRPKIEVWLPIADGGDSSKTREVEKKTFVGAKGSLSWAPLRAVSRTSRAEPVIPVECGL